MQINSRKVTLSWQGILIFLLIYVSNDTFLFGTNSNELFLSIPRFGAIAVIAYLLTRRTVEKLTLSKYVYLLAMVAFYLFSCISNHETITITGIFLIYIVLAFFLVTRVKFDQFFFYFNKHMYFFAVVAIFFEVIAYVAPNIIEMFPKMANTNGVPICNMFFNGIIHRYLHTATIRTNGIFWEPGVFQFYLNFSIAYQLFRMKNPDYKHIVVMGIAVFFTFSTSGYITLLYLIMTFVLFSNINRKAKILSAITLMLLISAIFVFSSDFVYNNVFYKLFDLREGTTVARYGSIIASIMMAIEKPLTGVGMANMEMNMMEKTFEIFRVAHFSNTNTFFYPFAAHGLLFGMLFAIGTYRFSKYFGKRRIASIMIFGFILLVYASEKLMSPLPFIFVFYGVFYKKNDSMIPNEWR